MFVPALQPFPAATLLGYLGPRLTPGVESVGNGSYTRTGLDFSYDGAAGGWEVTSPGTGPTDGDLERLAALFRYRETWQVPPALADDPVVGPRAARVPGFRPLGAWEPFELCLRTVVGQQVSVAAAGTLMRRLGAKAGGWTPERVAAADLANLGMPGRRTTTLRVPGPSTTWPSAWVATSTPSPRRTWDC